MLDILLRGGLTVEDLLLIEKAVAEAHYLAENHARLLNGHEAETQNDYALIYRVMQEDLDDIECRDLQRGIAPTEYNRLHERNKWMKAANPYAKAHRDFEYRQGDASRKRREEGKLMMKQDAAS